MNTQHTPGPWTYEYSNDVGDDDAYFIEFYEVRTPDYKEVARVDNKADARLIAAAPDLLEVLQYFMPFIDSEQDDERQGPWVEKARAAIARATNA
jgi:hypothetical protein